ncbi:MAG: hypothetical protein V4617_15805 [Gemmatimonadota bacterium]
MAIGITAKQRADLAAMLPNIEESVTSLKRLIADAKDRTRALQKLDEAEAAQKRHANDVGIPFNTEAFARRRAELNALPKVLTVEEGQLASFSALQRAIGVILEGPYTREGRRGATAGKRGGQRAAASKSGAKHGGKAASRKTSDRKAAGGRKSAVSKSPAAKRGSTGPSSKPRSRSAGKADKLPTPAPGRTAVRGATAVSSERNDQAQARMPMQKPLPLALGS